jgi:hypothetical protein
VKVELRTKVERVSDQRPTVFISANEIVCSVASMDEKIRLLQVAKRWLQRELKK